jgi:hypothetical protein
VYGPLAARNMRREAERHHMIVLRRQESWTDGPRRLRLHWNGLDRLRLPVLVASAALFGAAAAAAVLVTFWDRESGRRVAVETKLAASQKHAKALTGENAWLRRRLARSLATSAELERSAARLRAAAQSLLRPNAALVASASRLRGQGGSLEGQAAAVSKLADTLGSSLVAVLDYVSNTSLASLDPGYLQAQLNYLKPAVAKVRSAADALGADAGTYATAVDAFADEAAGYATALRRLREAAGAD